jgi:hypothetical protein
MTTVPAARIRVIRTAAWVIPAVPAVVVTGYLAWGAWVSVRDPRWLTLSHAWWRGLLRPADNTAVLVVVVLWLAALVCYWWPRRLHAQTVGLTTVVAMVVIGGVLGAASLIPCGSAQTGPGVLAWVLDLYVGQPPAYPSSSLSICPGQPPLALQLASSVCLSATFAGAVVAAAVLWGQPVGRLRARLVRDATVVAGLDAMSVSLVRRLAETGRPGHIVVIEPDAGHPLLDEVRATGARIMIADPTSPHVLLPVLAAGRGCALRYLYALRQDVLENEAILAAAGIILRRYRPAPERQPHLIARIDDPRHADHWRGRHSGTADPWFEDALSPQESTARALITQIFRAGPRQLLLCGDSTLALAILLELALRAWEREGLAKAAALGQRHASPAAAGLDEADRLALAGCRLDRVVLLDRRANDLRREYLATSPPAIAGGLPPVRVQARPWKDYLLAELDAMTRPEAAQTAVVVADLLSEDSMHEAGRVARLHPGTPVYVLSSDGSGIGRAIFDLLQPFQRAFLVDGEPPEDTWTRIARHWHECYRLTHPVAGSDPRSRGRRPWAELDDFIRQDNVLQLQSIMAAVVARGRSWVPGRAVAPGSFIELSQRDLEEVARAEHTRWYERRLAAGWRPPGGPGGGARVNSSVVPWDELPADERDGRVDYVRTQLAQLEDVGFMPVVPRGGPAGAVQYRRVGIVRARRLQGRRPWTRRSGDQLCGDAGDWRVADDSGDERTVRDLEFRASHELLGGDRWRRTGTFPAWQVSEELAVRTMEGRAVARPGDWIVEGSGGERWPVTSDQFGRTYRRSTPAGSSATGAPEAAGPAAP